MSGIKTYEGSLLVDQHAKFGIAFSRFNSYIGDSLLSGALDYLQRHGVLEAQINVFKAPGAYELPLLVQRMAVTQRFNAIIALGVVIRGGTPHFEYVAGEATKGLASVALKYDLPVAFGVLTVDTIEQAIERAGTKAGNKGAEAAASAVEMLNLLQQIEVPKVIKKS